MRKRFFSASIVGFILCGACLWSPAMARRELTKNIWDGNLTEGKSGVEGDLLDPGNTDGKSGLKSPPQTFFIPPPRQYADVDLAEEEDNKHHRHKEYSPYALARFTQSFTYAGKALPKGYYEVKLGNRRSGSEATNLRNEAGIRRTLVLKQLGKVIAVLPVEHVRSVDRSRKEKKQYKNPVAAVVFENHLPYLQYETPEAVFYTELGIP